MRKTTANRLLKAITDNLVSVTSAVVNHDEGMKEPISVEKFKEDLEFYTNSGIFADTIDFSYEKIAENKLHIAIGKASCYCYDDIDVTLQLSDGVDMELLQNSYIRTLTKNGRHKERKQKIWQKD